MPFDSQGNFTRSYNWTADKLAGIKIQSARMDGEFDNFANGMNQVVMRNGSTPITGDLKLGGNNILGLGSGTALAPSLQFFADTTTGIFLASPGNMGLVASGVERLRVFSGGANVTGTLAAGGVVINGPASTGRGITYQTNGVARWSVNESTTAETGANAGSDYNINRYDDTGTIIDNPLSITRSTGIVIANKGLTVNGPVTYTGNVSITGSFGVNGAVTVNGNLSVAGSSTLSLTVFNGPAYFNANVSNTYPNNPGGGAAITWNYLSGAGEVDFWNTYTPASVGFDFYQQTGPSAATLLARFARTGNTFYGSTTISGGALTSPGIVSNGQLTISPGPVVLNGAPGTNGRILYYQSNGAARFYHGIDGVTEAGGNVGSNFFIARSNDAGAYLDTPFQIYRDTGNVVFAHTVTANDIAANGTMWSNVSYTLNGAPTSNRYFFFDSNGSTRWSLLVGDGSAESGGNAGSNFYIQSYTDAGAGLTNVLQIIRSTGVINVAVGLTIPTRAQHDNSTFAATTAYVDAAVVGAVGGGGNATGSATLVGPIQTISTTNVCLGLNTSITPTKTGRVQVIVTGTIFSTTAPQTLQMQINRSNTPNQAPPASLSPAVGSVLNLQLRVKTNSANIWFPFCMTGVATGLTVGSSYWFDVMFATQAAANAANLQDVMITLIEL